MTTSPGRLLLALEAAEESLALIEVASRLAAALGRELVGLLVPDPGLAAAAALPFTRLQPRRGPGPALFDRPDMERAVRAFTRLVERRLAAACAGHSVRWSLRVAAGPAAMPPPSAGDLLVLGPGTPPAGLTTPSIIMVRPGGGSVVLVHGNGDGLLDVARRTARRERLPLVVIRWGAAAPIGAGRADAPPVDPAHPRGADAVALAGALRHHAPAILFLDVCLGDRDLAMVLAALQGAPEPAAGYSGATG